MMGFENVMFFRSIPRKVNKLDVGTLTRMKQLFLMNESSLCMPRRQKTRIDQAGVEGVESAR